MDDIPRTELLTIRCKAANLVSVVIACQLMFLSFSTWAIDGQHSFDDILHRWNSSLESAEATLSLDTNKQSKTRLLLENITIIKESASIFRAKSTAQLLKQRNLLNALGPVPETGTSLEADEVIEQRSAFNQSITLFDGQVKRCSVVIARTYALLEQITAFELKKLSNAFYERTPFPFTAQSMATAAKQLPIKSAELSNTRLFWLNQIKINQNQNTGFASLFSILLVVITTGFFLARWLRHQFGCKSTIEQLTSNQKFIAVMIESLTRIILPIAIITILTWIVFYTYDIEGNPKSFLLILIFSLMKFILINALSKVILMPNFPQYRICQLTNQAAKGLTRSVLLLTTSVLVIEFFTTIFMGRSTGLLDVPNISSRVLPQELFSIIAMLSLLTIALLILNVLRGSHWRFVDREKDPIGDKLPPLNYRFFIYIARIALLSCIVLGLAGYLNFALFVLVRTSMALFLIIITKLLHEFFATLLVEATSTENRFGRWLHNSFHINDADNKRSVFWTTILFDTLLIAALVPTLLLIFGMPWGELNPILTGLIFGTQIGDFSFSLINFGIALGILFLLLIGVSFFQRLLSDHILVQTSFDIGVRDAVTSGFGYVGVVIAVLIALSMLGLKMSELALIFGALSVGIGFGLQHVANNFISGLVLLIQRPIKAGDWIVVGDKEGYVKHVNVITTEIQTFDNAALIVPNSDLVSSQVINWMHKNKLGRVIIPVGVSYDSDPEQVKILLLQCAEDNSDILQRPAPNVIFKDFGDSAMLFELRFFIRNMDEYWRSSSAIRFAIKKAFDSANISIPFPQRDIHIHETDISKRLKD